MRQGFQFLALLFVLVGFCVGCSSDSGGKNAPVNTKDAGPGQPKSLGGK